MINDLLAIFGMPLVLLHCLVLREDGALMRFAMNTLGSSWHRNQSLFEFVFALIRRHLKEVFTDAVLCLSRPTRLAT